MIEQSVRPSRRRFTWAMPLLIVAVLAGVAIWIWSTATTTATWLGSSAGMVFSVAMNTHAVDLDSYDLKQLATLRIDGGREVQPTSWEAPKGGHHRSGTLTFPATDTDGRPLIASGTRTIELVIRDVAGVPERVFAWRQ